MHQHLDKKDKLADKDCGALINQISNYYGYQSASTTTKLLSQRCAVSHINQEGEKNREREREKQAALVSILYQIKKPLKFYNSTITIHRHYFIILTNKYNLLHLF